MCLRFFTVYRPRQRPDMAIRKLAHCIKSWRPFSMNGDGKSSRDYTYISDIESGICASSNCEDSFDIFNLGSGNPISLSTMIKVTSEVLGTLPILEEIDLPSSEPKQTFTDIGKAASKLGYSPRFTFQQEIERFISWFQESQKRVIV
jgi:UDP-glucuronate 4-epimerase